MPAPMRRRRRATSWILATVQPDPEGGPERMTAVDMTGAHGSPGEGVRTGPARLHTGGPDAHAGS